jgi:hypothetical protein
MVHARRGDAFATLACQGVVAQHHQRLVGRDPLQREHKHHPAQGIQRPRGAREEAVEAGDVALPDTTGGQRDFGHGAAALPQDPAEDQPLEDGHAPRLETRRAGAQQYCQRRR